MGFGVESGKGKTNAAEVGRWWGTAWGDANPGHCGIGCTPFPRSGLDEGGQQKSPYFNPGTVIGSLTGASPFTVHSGSCAQLFFAKAPIKY